MKRSWPAAALILSNLLSTPACASPGGTGGASPSAVEPIEVRRGVEGSTETVIQRGRALGGIVEAPLPAVFAALQVTYEELGLTVTIRVPAEGRIGSEGRRLVRLSGRRASHWVDCGSDLSGPVADQAHVLVTVLSALHAAEGGRTLVATRVDAEARTRGGIEGVRDCTSTGRLEALIHQSLLERLAR